MFRFNPLPHAYSLGQRIPKNGNRRGRTPRLFPFFGHISNGCVRSRYINILLRDQFFLILHEKYSSWLAVVCNHFYYNKTEIKTTPPVIHLPNSKIIHPYDHH
jgi:hypothetical protein